MVVGRCENGDLDESLVRKSRGDVGGQIVAEAIRTQSSLSGGGDLALSSIFLVCRCISESFAVPTTGRWPDRSVRSEAWRRG